MLQLPGLPTGIYFNLAESAYHADSALSRGDLVKLLDTPRTYWKDSNFNPDRKPRKTTPEMEYGKGFHQLLFEPKEFARTYQIVPVDEYHPEKKKLEFTEYYKMVESIKVLRAAREAKMWITNGMPEVTIIFEDEDTGLRFRTRHDYLGLHQTTDFKGVYSLHPAVLKTQFREHGYHIQLYLYKRARREFKKAWRDTPRKVGMFGRVDPAWMQRFMDSESDEFMFLFQRKLDPFPFLPVWAEDDTEQAGMDDTGLAVKRYVENHHKYGKAPWPACDGKPRSFSMFYGFRDNS